jgi:gamma-glutamyltranspeptidase/glutathione hydrolase
MDDAQGAPLDLAPGPSVPRPVRARHALQFGLAVPRSDLFVACVMLCLPVVGWAALHGWLAELQRRMHKNSPQPLPALRLADLGNHARRGFGAWAIAHAGSFALLLALAAIATVTNFGALVALLVAGELAVPLVVLALAAVALGSIAAWGTLFLDAALTRTELATGAIDGVFGAWQHARAARLKTLAAYVAFAPLATGMLIVGAVLCGVGLLPAFVIVQVSAAHLRAQLYRERVRRGGELLPAHAPALLPSERKRVPRLPPAAVTALLALVACTKSPPPVEDGTQAAPLKSAPAPVASSAAPPAPAAPAVTLRGGGEKAVRGEHGLVTSVEAHATRAGVAILERGGNAVDAAVAVGYALAVTHPSAGNIGGGGFMLVRMKGKPTIAIDFRETAPSGLTQEKFDRMIENGALGPAAVGIPGTPAGLNLAHRRYGKLPLPDVLAPAIELATKGHRIGARQGQTIAWAWPELRKDPAARAVFGDGKDPKKPGAWLKQPDLARVLERIAEKGDAGFYTGPTAQALERALAPAGMIAQKDFAAYQAKIREPLEMRYRGLDVQIMPPPSAGGVALALTLGVLERLRANQHPPGSAAELHLFIEASKRAHSEKRFAVLDPDTLSLDALAERRRRWVDAESLLARTPAIDPTRATPSSAVHPLFAAAMRELDHTTHYSVVDGDGNVVSCTTTLSAGFGARIVAGGAGIVLNNAVAAFGTAGENLPAPGRRTTSSMAPTLVSKNGEIVLVLGSPGGDTIPSTVAQVLRNTVDHGMTIDRAVDAPRIHHGFVPDEVRYEGKRPPPRDVLQALEKLGHRMSDKRLPIGDANDILIEGGVAYGYADPREGGLALAARPPKP